MNKQVTWGTKVSIFIIGFGVLVYIGLMGYFSWQFFHPPNNYQEDYNNLEKKGP